MRAAHAALTLSNWPTGIFGSYVTRSLTAVDPAFRKFNVQQRRKMNCAFSSPSAFASFGR